MAQMLMSTSEENPDLTPELRKRKANLTFSSDDTGRDLAKLLSLNTLNLVSYSCITFYMV